MNTLKDFYPTNKIVIAKMLDGVKFGKLKTILEPSAGKGDIVDAVKEAMKYRYYDPDIDLIEINKDLQSVLTGKGYRVVHDDFLTYDTMKEYDLIIMNPPFSNGCKHLLKAIQLQKRNGGAIICILNAETLKNPYTNERKELLRILSENHADIEYLQDAFLEGERTTNVEIALIKVVMPEVQRDSKIWDALTKAKTEVEYQADEKEWLAENDFIKSIVAQYKKEVEAGVKLIKEYEALSPYILSCFKKNEQGETVQTGGCMLSLKNGYGNEKASVNGYISDVREKYWNALLSSPKFTGKLTSNLQTEYSGRIGELRNYEFSLYNIYEMKISMTKNVVKGIEDAIISLFDEMSHKHSWYDETSANVHYYNGWKTNKSWIINKKVILPMNAFSYTYVGNTKRFDPGYTVCRKLSDIEKCFNYLDGGLTESIDLYETMRSAEKMGVTKNIRLKYFTVTFYKKGTCHFTFTNEELLKKFNIFGSQYKGWLPPTYGKVKYSDMTEEEKKVVDEFQGEAEYNKVLCNKDYYLSDVGTMLMLDVAE